MKVTINGRAFDYEVNGTVGLAYKAEQVLGEPLDMRKKMHLAAVCYAALFYSNGGDVMPWHEFISTLTSEPNNQMIEHLTRRWKTLEGEKPDGGNTEGE